MPAALADRDAILICLPTPLDEHRAPDLSFVLAGAETAIAHLAPGALLVLESTTWPGTTREVVAPMLEASGRTHRRGLLPRVQPRARRPGQHALGHPRDARRSSAA